VLICLEETAKDPEDGFHPEQDQEQTGRVGGRAGEGDSEALMCAGVRLAAKKCLM